MENASKALIIAGAILLSILIISLGLIVYNQAKETVGSVNLNEQEIAAFNAKFTSYEGTNMTGSQVNALIQAVISSNQAAINSNTGNYIGLQFPTVSDQSGGTYVYIQVTSDAMSLSYSEVTTAVSGVNALSAQTNSTTASNTSKSLKVSTGKTYTVTLGYTNSIVSKILVKMNS